MGSETGMVLHAVSVSLATAFRLLSVSFSMLGVL